MASNVPDATKALYDILEPFSEQDRSRIVTAALVLLGQEPTAPLKAPSGTGGIPNPAVHQDSESGFGPKATRWLNQHSLTEEMLEHAFHLDPEVPEVVGEVPGKSAKERTTNAYLLTGAAHLLKSDEPTFDDSTARAVCEHGGFYDPTNHTKYIKFGNKASGSKKSGWKLLGPGLKEAASIVKQMAGVGGGTE